MKKAYKYQQNSCKLDLCHANSAAYKYNNA